MKFILEHPILGAVALVILPLFLTWVVITSIKTRMRLKKEFNDPFRFSTNDVGRLFRIKQIKDDKILIREMTKSINYYNELCNLQVGTSSWYKKDDVPEAFLKVTDKDSGFTVIENDTLAFQKWDYSWTVEKGGAVAFNFV